MAAGLGFKTFTTGEVLTAADTNGYLMQGVLVFADAAARDAAITSPQEGQFAFTKDDNSLFYYSGAAWVVSGASGDVTGVTAGTGVTVTDPTGPVPTVSIDTATTVDKTTAQTLTNKTLTSPVLTTPTISTIDAKGDLLAGTADNTVDRLAVGTDGQTLVADSAEATGLKWATAATGMTNPLTTTGDTIYSSSGTTPARLGIGSTGQVLTVASGIPSWATTSATAASYTLLNSGGTALSGTTTTISGISGKGTLYVMVVGGSTGASGSTFDMRLNGDSTTKYGWCGTLYQFAAAYSTNNFYSTYSMLDTKFRLGLMGNNTASEFSGGAVIQGCNSTSNKMYQTFGNGSPGGGNSQAAYQTIGFYSGTGTVSSVSIVSSGTFDAGTVYVYASA